VSAAGSSDEARQALPLAHARFFESSEVLTLESGDTLPGVRVCYETWGELDEDRANAVLVCHALSGDSHVARHDAEDDPGWWDLLVGPGKAIDTNRYFVVCSNVLGGCRGTTGPNFTRPEGDRPYGADFPVVTVRDMVETQRRLLDQLGIDRLLAVVGGSLGGLQAMTWGIDHPERVGACVVVAASPRLSSQGIAFDVVGRNAIRHDPRFAGGQYYDGQAPEAGLALARMLAHITYLSDESMRAKFDPTRLQPRSIETGFESVFSVGSYLALSAASREVEQARGELKRLALVETLKEQCLVVGLVPEKQLSIISTDEYGFCSKEQVAGIHPVASARRPLDVASSVKDATASALKSMRI